MKARSIKLDADPYYATDLGAAYLGDAANLLAQLGSASVNLIVTSPPFALHFKKEYGNVDKEEYVDWFLKFAVEFFRVLKDDGSLVIDIGGSYEAGRPTRSLYQFDLLIALCRRLHFHLAQEFFWYNPAKLPSPAEWVTVRRIRVKDAVNFVWWLSKTPTPKADNRKVLRAYSPDMKRLIRRGYRPKKRPSGHNITPKFDKGHGGSIPANLLVCGNNDSNGGYLKACKAAGIKPHPARFPPPLPRFFIRFLTSAGDLVLDPFAGSNPTGAVCEQEGRRWLAFELREQYLAGSRFKFPQFGGAFGESEDGGTDGVDELPLFRR